MLIHLIVFAGIIFLHNEYKGEKRDVVVECVEKCGTRLNIFDEENLLLDKDYCLCKDEVDDGGQCANKTRDDI